MSDFIDSRDNERSAFGNNLPKSVDSVWHTFHCERLQASMLAKACIKRRRAGDDPGCEDCAIGKYHEKYLGKTVSAMEAAPKVRSLPKEEKRKLIPVKIEVKPEVKKINPEPKGTEMQGNFITVKEAAKITGYSTWSVTEMCKSGKIKAKKSHVDGVNRDCWLVDPASLEGIRNDGPKPQKKEKKADAPIKAVITLNPPLTLESCGTADVRVLSDEKGKVIFSETADLFLPVNDGIKNLVAAIATGRIDAQNLCARLGA